MPRLMLLFVYRNALRFATSVDNALAERYLITLVGSIVSSLNINFKLDNTLANVVFDAIFDDTSQMELQQWRSVVGRQ